MKRIIFLTALIAVILCSYSNKTMAQMTAEQKAIVEEEVSEQLDKHLVSLSTLNYEMWLEFICKDNFVPGFIPGVVGILPDYDRYVGAIKDSFARRVRQQYETLKIEITPLSQE